MIDLSETKLLTLPQACRLLPRPPSPATLWRWRTRGVRIGDRTIRLECVRIGGRWYTDSAAVSRWAQAMTEAASAAGNAPPSARDPATAEALREKGIRV